MKLNTEQLAERLRNNPDLRADFEVGDYLATAHEDLLINSERELQQAVIDAADMRALADKRWGLLMAIPNGQYRRGQRMEPGLRAGMPDLFLPVARKATATTPAYHGMFIELKVGNNQMTVAQQAMMGRLAEQGYYTICLWSSALPVLRVVEWYLGDAP